MKTSDTSKPNRRSVLKGAAVTTVAIGTGSVAGQAMAEDISTVKPKSKQGYRETRHVKEYYRLARF